MLRNKRIHTVRNMLWFVDLMTGESYKESTHKTGASFSLKKGRKTHERSEEPMKIIVDAMGGDNAPGEIIRGAAAARKSCDVEIVLVGRENEIYPCLSELGAAADPGIQVVHAEEVIGMAEGPSAIRQKKDSSMVKALRLLSEGEGDAVVSAGGTGALLSGATLIVKRVRGVRRACLAPILPNGNRGAVLLDCGANAECTEEYLLQFAFMGSFYARKMLGYPSPRVALLNIGGEADKGGELQKKSYALLSKACEARQLRFVGNIEGSEIFADKADVIVADGFSGNVLLKTVEGTAKFLMANLKSAMNASVKSKIGALLVKDDLRSLKKLLDPSEVGGTPLLGITKPVVKAHGGSDARAIENAVKQARRSAKANIARDISEHIEEMRLGNAD